MTYPFLKGHGTENDFVLLPDHDGSQHGELSAERVRALCDRRAGIGADGVLRVVRSEALKVDGPEWFMDYRNADGSLSEMCGNGVRVFARHLVEEGLATLPVEVGTRAGIKVVTAAQGDLLTVDMGGPVTFGQTPVTVGERRWAGVHVDLGNPHAVALVEDLAEAGPLLESPGYDEATYPHGVNVEFAVRRGERHVAMRVHERGSGETRSCGTGACAVMVAAALADGVTDPPEDDLTYRVDVPGGELAVTWTADDRVLLTGPAVVVARGTTDL
ncbi:diaminopimelate epimerase [uncultured Nocardioides sp.]|uniref:diaminopimelate epimerase n=1 Tax=uncultured Nocardioides sp. TaxID=198441 RepID=UPI0025E7A118|nr:diaminopimelate epimerase [uncultured Nocardioides sp.]